MEKSRKINAKLYQIHNKPTMYNTEINKFVSQLQTKTDHRTVESVRELPIEIHVWTLCYIGVHANKYKNMFLHKTKTYKIQGAH